MCRCCEISVPCNTRKVIDGMVRLIAMYSHRQTVVVVPNAILCDCLVLGEVLLMSRLRNTNVIASTTKQILWKLNLTMPICQITNSPKNIASYWSMAHLYVRQRSTSIDKKFAMTAKDFAEPCDYMNIFHHAPTTMLLPKKRTNHGHHQKADVGISNL